MPIARRSPSGCSSGSVGSIGPGDLVESAEDAATQRGDGTFRYPVHTERISCVQMRFLRSASTTHACPSWNARQLLWAASWVDPPGRLRWYRRSEQPVGEIKVDFATPLNHRPRGS